MLNWSARNHWLYYMKWKQFFPEVKHKHCISGFSVISHNWAWFYESRFTLLGVHSSCCVVMSSSGDAASIRRWFVTQVKRVSLRHKIRCDLARVCRQRWWTSVHEFNAENSTHCASLRASAARWQYADLIVHPSQEYTWTSCFRTAIWVRRTQHGIQRPPVHQSALQSTATQSPQ